MRTAQARRIWLRAQRLDESAPFGAGPAAVQAAVEHLGYVQIDTIHVVERCAAAAQAADRGSTAPLRALSARLD